MNSYMAEDIKLRSLILFSKIRSSAFKHITRQKGGVVQWKQIMGKANRNKNGSLIKLSNSTEDFLQGIVNYYQTSSGIRELDALGIAHPEHIDDIADWIQNALTRKELKRQIFLYMLKNFKESSWF